MPRQWNDLGGILRRFEPDMARAIEEALRRLGSPSERLLEALQRGNIDAAMEALPWAETMSALERRIYRLALMVQSRAAREAAPQLPRPVARYSFDLTNPRAIQAAQQQAGDLIREVTVETRLAVRDIVVRGQRDGLEIREQVKLIRQHVGLTQRQANAVYNYRQGLVESGRSPEQVDRMTGRRYQRAIRQRSTTIARTETIRASNSGQQELWRQAREAGIIPAGARRVWVASPDACEFCRPMNGQVVGLEEAFQSGQARGAAGQVRQLPSTLTPPIHPRCRCSISLEVAA